jgi:uncharacterized protein YjgD (DUF1641 family)
MPKKKKQKIEEISVSNIQEIKELRKLIKNKKNLLNVLDMLIMVTNSRLNDDKFSAAMEGIVDDFVESTESDLELSDHTSDED